MYMLQGYTSITLTHQREVQNTGFTQVHSIIIQQITCEILEHTWLKIWSLIAFHWSLFHEVLICKGSWNYFSLYRCHSITLVYQSLDSKRYDALCPLLRLPYYHSTCIMQSSLCKSFEDRVPVNVIYGCPIFEWVPVIWLIDRAPG